MKMKTSSWLSLAIVLSAGLAGTAQAATASSKITGLTIKLIDLAPDDGIDPSVTFSGQTSWTTFSFSNVFLEDQHSTPTPLAAGSAQVTGDRVSASSSSSGNAFTATATVLGDGTRQSRSASAYASLYNPFGGGSTFTLSPNTLMSIVGSYELAVSRSVGETGDIAAYVNLELSGGDPVFGQQFGSVNNQVGGFVWQGTPLQETKTANFGLSFINTRGQAVSGAFNVAISAQAAVVPEPTAPLLGLLGAACALGLARRHAARARA